MSRFQIRLALIIGVCLFSVMARFLPHLPNFSPLLAVSVFAGAMIPTAWLGLALSLGVVFFSDVTLALFGNVAQHGGSLFYPGMAFVYISYVISFLIGLGLGRAPNARGIGSAAKTIFFGSVFSSVVFFLLSNLGVWLFTGMYKPTMTGFVDCFVLALPFFGNTLISTMISLGVLYTLEMVAARLISSERSVAARS